MIKFLKSKSLFNHYIIWILSSLISANQKYKTLELTTSFGEDELNQLYFDDNSKTYNKCQNWIPALFNPIMLIHYGVSMSELTHFDSFDMISPVFQTDGKPIDIRLYKYFFFDKYDDIIFGKNLYNKEIIKQCYFGLSKGLGNYQKIDESQINLNMLKNKEFLEEKIFSFDKWIINESNNTINSFLYLGDIHENFLSKNGIIGTCKVEEKDSYWGCSFKEMNFNNNIISLKKDKDTYYKIYISSENHLIIFPELFKEEFKNMTNDICKEDDDSKYLICNDLFNPENYFSIKLIDDNMIITIEVDNWNRFTLKDSPEEKYKTRIKFDNNEFFIFPLIMFKNFHVQFDSNDNKISFYTTNDKILELKNKNEEDNSERQEPENNSSNAGTIILIIFIVLLIIALGIGVFWFINKRRSSADKNINKYNKFEEDETFHNMDEKRVF